MKSVYKYLLEAKHGPQTILLPQGAKILHLDLQGDEIFIWAEVRNSSPLDSREFHCFGTGETIIGDYDYIGTVQQPSYGLNYVWHFYEKVRP